MKVKDLIEKLNELDPDLDVCIYDWKMNMYHADGEPNGNGIQAVNVISLEDNDKEEDDDWRPLKWVALEYDNQDYDDDVTKIE